MRRARTRGRIQQIRDIPQNTHRHGWRTITWKWLEYIQLTLAEHEKFHPLCLAGHAYPDRRIRHGNRTHAGRRDSGSHFKRAQQQPNKRRHHDTLHQLKTFRLLGSRDRKRGHALRQPPDAAALPTGNRETGFIFCLRNRQENRVTQRDSGRCRQ